MGLNENDSPRWRDGAWTYRPGIYGGEMCVMATWLADDEPTWCLPIREPVSLEMRRRKARRVATGLATGRMIPALLPEWIEMEPTHEVVGLAS